MSDDTTPNTTATTTDTNVATDDTNNGAEHMIPKWRFNEVNDRMKTAEEKIVLLNQQLEEKASYVPLVEVAKAKYWTAIVESEEVQAVLTKYPNMAYDDAIKLSWVVKSKTATEVTQGTSFVGRPSGVEPAAELSLAEQEIALTKAAKDGTLSI